MKEYNAILVVVDCYTKIVKFIPTTMDILAPKFAALFHKSIKLQYSSLRGIVLD